MNIQCVYQLIQLSLSLIVKIMVLFVQYTSVILITYIVIKHCHPIPQLQLPLPLFSTAFSVNIFSFCVCVVYALVVRVLVHRRPHIFASKLILLCPKNDTYSPFVIFRFSPSIVKVFLKTFHQEKNQNNVYIFLHECFTRKSMGFPRDNLMFLLLS